MKIGQVVAAATVSLAGVLMTATMASATTINKYSFADLNGIDDGGVTYADKYRLDVEDVDGGVYFSISNLASVTSITKIAFSDPLDLLGAILDIDDDRGDDGVDFVLSDPNNMPQFNSASLAVDVFSEACQGGDCQYNGYVNNGIQSNEFLGLLVSLSSGTTYQDVIDALDSGVLKIGLHVQQTGIGQGSDVVVTTPPIPLPASALLLMTAIGGLGLMRRRKSA